MGFLSSPELSFGFVLYNGLRKLYIANMTPAADIAVTTQPKNAGQEKPILKLLVRIDNPHSVSNISANKVRD